MDRAELLKKYNVPAPRYTSYPTVPYWDSTPSQEQWLEHIHTNHFSSGQGAAGAALYIHIPFCENLCTFCGCNTRITRNHQVVASYIEKIHQEWRLYRDALVGPHQIRVAELHLGGGTPTFFSASELQALLNPILEDVLEDGIGREFSVEIDPRVTTEDQLAALAQLGFGRVSMGIQDFDPKVQQVVNRIQSVEQVRRLTHSARQLGYASVNFDLIYGLPFQTEAGIEKTFATVIDLSPDRIAFYAYAHVPWIKPTHRRFSEQDLPSAALKRRLYEHGRELLENHGYAEIGMDHFAKRSDPLWHAYEGGNLHRNFMGYTPNHLKPQLGLGVSAIGDADTALMQNEKVLEKYYMRLEKGELPILRGHALNAEDLVLRRHILNLMTRFSTTWNDMQSHVAFLAGVPERLREFEVDGLVKLNQAGVSVLPAGRPFIRNIVMAFDARLARRAPDTALFSTSI